MSHHTETGDVTGTKDKDYNLVWFVEACLSNALRMEEYCSDAERAGDQALGCMPHASASSSKERWRIAGSCV